MDRHPIVPGRTTVTLVPVVGVAIAMGYFAARGSRLLGESLIILAMAMAVLLKARRTLLAATILALIIGSVPNAVLKEGAFYLRFELLAALAVANVLACRRRYIAGDLRVMSIALGFLAAWAVVSAIWSVDRMLTAERAIGFTLLVAAVLTTALHWWSDVRTVRGDLTVVAGVLGAAMMASFGAFLAGAHWAYLGSRLRGIFENPNTLGMSGGLLLPVAAGLAQESRRPLERYAWVAVVILTVVLLGLDQSRNGMLGGLLGFLVFIIGRGGSAATNLKLGIVIATLVMILGVTFVPVSLTPAQDAFRSLIQRGSSGRLSAWALAWDLVRQRPLRGWGFGTTEQVFGPQAAAVLRGVFQGGLVHNGYLQLLLEAGPIALVLALVALGTTMLAGIRGSADPFFWAVFGASCGGMLMQGAESGIVAAGSIFALNFWLLAVATIRLRARPREDAARGSASGVQDAGG